MKRNQTFDIPRWLAKFILNETRKHPNNQQIFLAILEPMSPQEWCRIWIPIIHPDVEAPYPGERSPPGYMKASIMTLCKLTGGGRVYSRRMVLWKNLSSYTWDITSLFSSIIPVSTKYKNFR